MAKETFIIRTEWFEAIDKLKPKEQLLMMRNLFFYHNDRETEIELPSLHVTLVWKLIEPCLRRNLEKRNHAEKETYVYCIRLWNAETGDSFIKIGISYFLDQRYSDYRRAGFDLAEIWVKLFLCKAEAEAEEYRLHRLYADSRYKPKIQFCGYTECFSEDILNQMSHA